MKVTFEELKRKKRNQMDEKTEHIHEEEHRFVLTNEEYLRTHEYTELPQLTSYMQTQYGVNGFVYHVHYVDELFDQERYCFLFSFQERIREFAIFLKVRGEIQQKAQVNYVLLGEDWDTKKYCGLNPEVKDLFEGFQEVIYDLPEFRLLSVTGMLKKAGEK